MTAIGFLLQIRMSSTYVAKYSQCHNLSTIYKSGSCLVFLNPHLRSDSLQCSSNLAAEVFNPYKDLSIIRIYCVNLLQIQHQQLYRHSLLIFHTRRHFQCHMHNMKVRKALLRKRLFLQYPSLQLLNKYPICHLLSDYHMQLVLSYVSGHM
jgi:hypothetical protein